MNTPAAVSILVLGAGELGMHVLRSLSGRIGERAGRSVSALLRPSTILAAETGAAAHVGELQALGVALVPGDVAKASVEELAEVFRHYDTVVSCVGFASGPGTQLKLAKAAVAAGVRRYVPWQFGVDYDVIGRGSAQDLFDEQLEVRDLLRGQTATRWIIVSTGMFTSFLFEPSFGVVDLAAGTVRALGSWSNEVTITTPEDIGLLTAEILLAEPPIENEVVFVAGDTITFEELAGAVDLLLGRPVERVEWTVPLLQAELAADPQNGLKKYRVVFAAGRGIAWDPRETFNARRGIEVTDLHEWMRANLVVAPGAG